jgi:hypothetical protein
MFDGPTFTRHAPHRGEAIVARVYRPFRSDAWAWWAWWASGPDPDGMSLGPRGEPTAPAARLAADDALRSLGWAVPLDDD